MPEGSGEMAWLNARSSVESELQVSTLGVGGSSPPGRKGELK